MSRSSLFFFSLDDGKPEWLLPFYYSRLEKKSFLKSARLAPVYVFSRMVSLGDTGDVTWALCEKDVLAEDDPN